MCSSHENRSELPDFTHSQPGQCEAGPMVRFHLVFSPLYLHFPLEGTNTDKHPTQGPQIHPAPAQKLNFSQFQLVPIGGSTAICPGSFVRPADALQFQVGPS